MLHWKYYGLRFHTSGSYHCLLCIYAVIYPIMELKARPLCEIIEDIKLFLDNYDGNQEKLAEHIGVSQSTISRALRSLDRRRLSKGLRNICIYANIPTTTPTITSPPDPRKNKELISALAEVWDGSPAHAKALAKIIRDLKLLH